MSGTAFDCAECDRSAVGLVEVSDERKYLCNWHYRKAIEDWAGAIDEKRLLPTGTGEA